ncbi:MAG TPA: hypothetical protein VNO82_13475 [Solirubrobacteraceae bacterium]|nr:hypothetical protein [Solirubrobacteraceae bacterium]
MTRSLPITVGILALVALAISLRGEASARGDVARTVVLQVGDVMEVDGAPIGCQVARRGGRAVIDCRRAGRLAGTYGTLFDERRARVIRFRSDDTAKVVFKAKHRGRARRCDDAGAARASRKALR